ncbi:AMP-binding domain protein, putative [Rhizoctonia solani AG-3 Rhs1AP]|uniref:AMP-binding domain protein, putative n=1 Tax=Rhizoctonia solani AG-3 Rhs1AP TaxID=1086054 RepID=X8J001_9AGAM|nr:AMP-binding domain protein, putative [Rhizoctonia solani AG-3 Rhs1AP]
MGNTKPSVPVVGLLIPTPPPPAEIPQPEDLQPGPALVPICEFVRTHIAAIPEYIFPEIQVAAYPNPNMPRRGRGAQRALVVGPPPLALHAAPVNEIPIHCQRPLVLAIWVICSSAVLIWLSSLIGPVNVSTSILPGDLPVYLTRVVDVVNKHGGHVSRNVAAASACCFVQIGLRLVGVVCEATCDS